LRLSLADLSLADAAPLSFQLPQQLEAHEPPEIRGAGRDDVRLLVSLARGVQHAKFRDLNDFLEPGDLLVVNRSATIAAAFHAEGDRGAVRLHVSTRLPSDLFVVEPRGTTVVRDERLRLGGGGLVEILTPYRNSSRLWIARFYLPEPFLEYAARYGQPVRYRHSAREWPLERYQNVFATKPGSAEMPSAGRPITTDMLEKLRARGIVAAGIVLHCGVSSLERDEPPYEEAYEVPAETAALVRRTKRAGKRVIAVGTSVVRSLESSLDDRGQVVASRGWTDLLISPTHPTRTVDALLTGFHEPSSSHLAMLEAIAGRERIQDAYEAALARGYLWHEFGDSHLIFSCR
jgi:S-adenosylmethionine:tRNA ribosyltransferase-isomerase